MTKSDFTYTFDGWFYSVMPENRQAETEWNRLVHQEQSDHGLKIFAPHWPSFKTSLKQAGWTIRKAREVKMTKAQLDAIEAELTA